MANQLVTATYDGTSFQIVGLSVPSSTYELISSATASSSATIDFTSGFTSAYSGFVIVVDTVTPVTGGATLHARLSVASSFLATSTYAYVGTNQSSGSVLGTAGASQAQIVLTPTTALQNTDALYGTVRLFGLTGTTYRKSLDFEMTMQQNGTSVKYAGAGQNTTLAAVDGIRFLMSTGNILSGNFYLYGIKNA